MSEVQLIVNRAVDAMRVWLTITRQNMKRVGNVASNKIYNAQNKQPPVPVDADEADSAMERFIRSKYVPSETTPTATSRNGSTRPRTGSKLSDEGTPPPLPPKTGSSFFKKAAKKPSAFPLSFRSKKRTCHLLN